MKDSQSTHSQSKLQTLNQFSKTTIVSIIDKQAKNLEKTKAKVLAPHPIKHQWTSNTLGPSLNSVG